MSMAVETVWVFAQGSDGAPSTATLELLTKAQVIGWECVGVRRR